MQASECIKKYDTGNYKSCLDHGVNFGGIILLVHCCSETLELMISPTERDGNDVWYARYCGMWAFHSADFDDLLLSMGLIMC